jgi:hypothetical protein
MYKLRKFRCSYRINARCVEYKDGQQYARVDSVHGEPKNMVLIVGQSKKTIDFNESSVIKTGYNYHYKRLCYVIQIKYYDVNIYYLRGTLTIISPNLCTTKFG